MLPFTPARAGAGDTQGGVFEARWKDARGGQCKAHIFDSQLHMTFSLPYFLLQDQSSEGQSYDPGTVFWDRC